MKTYFVPHERLPGEGRCSVCDLPYSMLIPKEVEEHRAFHRRYRAAARQGWAPRTEAARVVLRDEAFALIRKPNATFTDRLCAADWYIESKYDEYLFGVLYYAANRMPFPDYFAKRIYEKGYLSQFGNDVAEEMRQRHSRGTVGALR